MRLVILDNYDLASEWAAKYICNRIIQFRPGQDRYFTLGLPTGSTPLGCYKKLIEYHKNGDLSFKYVKTFNMDEYVGLPRNHPESYHSYMWNNFFKHIDIDPNNAHILDGNATDLQAECDAFEKKIKEAGGIDLFVGGIGPDGHIAFNEPGSSLVSRTRLKTLAMDTILANAKYFDGDLSKVPTMALTVGVGTVMDAREVMILITGAHKAFALYKAIEEGVNHMWTVSAFQQHPRTIFVCDEDATLELRVKTVKYFKGCQTWDNLTLTFTNLITPLIIRSRLVMILMPVEIFMDLENNKPVNSLSLPLSQQRCSHHQVTQDSFFSQHPTRIIIHHLLTLTALKKSLLY
uniref:Glucosamine-6-phosphate isomerase n=1 Tax=Bos mutus grunniens TaxID=30521 RepID=A0A8B9W867_BOSMU